jgi:spore coat polysaccharide biosynthesis protein SpsF (cytidylyltransferase family)
MELFEAELTEGGFEAGETEYVPPEADTKAESTHTGDLLAQEGERPLTSKEASGTISRGIANPESWNEYKMLDGRIVEVTDEAVTVDCLLDHDEEVFEARDFDRRLFEGEVPVEEGRFVTLRMAQRPGKFVITVYDGEKKVDREPFTTMDTSPDFDDFDSNTMYQEPDEFS